jgi:16S rRNA (uracil1498-N3)-methyltransferase
VPRLYCPTPLAHAQSFALPPGPARHVQVLRLQPNDEVTLFNGEGGQWRAVVERMGRSDVQVRVTGFEDIECEAAVAVHLAVGLTANERMDWLVEKVTELGVASVQPLVTTRSVLRLAGERAQKKREHWHAVATAACEQCGRNRVPVIHEPVGMQAWLDSVSAFDGHKVVLSLSTTQTQALLQGRPADSKEWLCLSGPEGGLDAGEEKAALEAGFVPVSLGPRVLRAETAPIALLSALTLS